MILSENHLFVCTSLSSGGETDVSYPVLIQHALARSDKKKKKKDKKRNKGYWDILTFRQCDYFCRA